MQNVKQFIVSVLDLFHVYEYVLCFNFINSVKFTTHTLTSLLNAAYMCFVFDDDEGRCRHVVCHMTNMLVKAAFTVRRPDFIIVPRAGGDKVQMKQI